MLTVDWFVCPRSSLVGPCPGVGGGVGVGSVGDASAKDQTSVVSDFLHIDSTFAMEVT